MKPFRGKRTELGESVVVIQPAFARRCTWRRRSATTARPVARSPDRQGGRALLRAVLQAGDASADRCGLGSFEASSDFGGVARVAGRRAAAASCARRS